MAIRVIIPYFMKKLFNLLLVALLVAGISSCAKEDMSHIDNSSVVVTFSASLDQVYTRATNYGKGENINTLHYRIFDATTNEALTDLNGRATRLDNGSFKFSVEMIKGMTYDIALWAQDSTCTAYTLNGKVVEIDYDNAFANDDKRDAFCNYIDNVKTDSPELQQSIKLTRPFAQFNAASSTQDFTNTEANGLTLTKSSLTLNAYTKYNIETKKATDVQTVTFGKNTMPCRNGEEEILQANYKYLAMCYLPAPTTGCTINMVTLNVHGTNASNQTVTLTSEYNNVPIKQNFRTNILGMLLSQSTSFTASIEYGWAGPDENVNK